MPAQVCGRIYGHRSVFHPLFYPDKHACSSASADPEFRLHAGTTAPLGRRLFDRLNLAVQPRLHIPFAEQDGSACLDKRGKFLAPPDSIENGLPAYMQIFSQIIHGPHDIHEQPPVIEMTGNSRHRAVAVRKPTGNQWMVFSSIWIELLSFRFDTVVDVFLWGKTLLYFVRGFCVSARVSRGLKEPLGNTDHCRPWFASG